MVGESQEQLVGAGAGGGTGSNKTPTLEEYGTNLTTQANEVSDIDTHLVAYLALSCTLASQTASCSDGVLVSQGSRFLHTHAFVM